MAQRKGRIGRFDFVALGAVGVIGALIAVVLLEGDRTPLQVSHFSWAEQTIGVEEQQFTLAFNGPIEPNRLELQIEPSLPGTLSSSERALIYTLSEPPVYGTTYQVSLQGTSPTNEEIRFESRVPTRDRIFAYIGVDEEQGRLILYNLSQEQKTLLTPADLVVTDFTIYGDRNRLLFSAYERNDDQGFSHQQLYTVTTGLDANTTLPSGRVNLLLDSQNYQNVKFDVAANGKTTVVQRVNRQNPAESGLWVVLEDGTPRPLGIPADNFVIAPDGSTVAVEQSSGVALMPLSEGGLSEFYPGYGRILGFSPDGTQQLLVKYSPDYTRSLSMVAPEEERELLRTSNPIIDCRFEPQQETLFCLKTDLVEAQGQYREEPFLAAIDLKTTTEVPLLALPNYQDVQLSIAPDGTLLFDQVATSAPSRNSLPITAQGQAIAAGLVWQLPTDVQTLAPEDIVPEELLAGFHPVWLP